MLYLCAKLRIDRSTNNEDTWGGGGGWQMPKPKHVKRNPVRLG